MMMNRFWASVWSVVLYLLAVGLLQYIVGELATLFGLVTAPWVRWVASMLSLVVPLVATYTYIDWRWSWRGDHIGMAANLSAVIWGLGGLTLGVLAAIVTQVAVGGGFGALRLPESGVLSANTLMELLGLLLLSLQVELVFRGVAISRYQVDLTRREVLLAGLLTPFGWILIQQLFGGRDLSPQIHGMGTAAMSVAFTLLFLRTDSVWLTAGLRFGMVGTLALLGIRSALLERGALIIWGIVALVLLALEWKEMQGIPRRMHPPGGRRTTRGRTVRGPWGPH